MSVSVSDVVKKTSGSNYSYPGVTVVEKSANNKLSSDGKVSTTHVTQKSCPDTCVWKGKDGKPGPCYAENGLQGFVTRRLNKFDGEVSELSLYEADGIKRLTGKNPLRMHVVGDVISDVDAKALGEAVDVYRSKKGQRVWTYTHNHDLKRSSWYEISVLRSCETEEQCEKALAEGYAPAMVVSRFRSNRAYKLENGLKLIPCPNQTSEGRIKCVDCKLCFDDAKLKSMGAVIGFSLHGPTTAVSKAEAKLIQLTAKVEA